MKNLTAIIQHLLITPHLNEDRARKTRISNFLLLGISLLASIAVFLYIGNHYYLLFTNEAKFSSSMLMPVILCLFFWLLFIVSKRGHYTISSLLLIITIFVGAIYTTVHWGITTPQGLLLLVLIIISSGILINSKFLIISTGFISVFVVLVGFLQIKQHVHFDSSWRLLPIRYFDLLVYLANFWLIAAISWLSTKEIEKSLYQSKLSEKALKKERNLLELKVIARTQELNKVQLEKIYQLYRFAELGRSTAGLFHDLVNPLTIASLNLEQANHQEKNHQLQSLQKPIKQASLALKRLENFIKAVQSNIKKQDVNIKFCLNQEINNARQILAYKAKKLKVKIIFVAKKKIVFYGNPYKFNQVMTNIISNSIDAFYKSKKSPKHRLVKISLNKHQNQIVIKIQDWGCGILKKNLAKIYDPFFTTKKPSQGTGIGLTISKKIIKKDFKGQITCQSTLGKGSVLIIKLPITPQVPKKL